MMHYSKAELKTVRRSSKNDLFCISKIAVACLIAASGSSAQEDGEPRPTGTLPYPALYPGTFHQVWHYSPSPYQFGSVTSVILPCLPSLGYCTKKANHTAWHSQPLRHRKVSLLLDPLWKFLISSGSITLRAPYLTHYCTVPPMSGSHQLWFLNIDNFEPC